MGSGVARQIREKWPHVYQSYHKATEDYAKEHGREALLGKVQFVKVTERTSIVNMFGQNKPSKRCEDERTTQPQEHSSQDYQNKERWHLIRPFYCRQYNDWVR